MHSSLAAATHAPRRLALAFGACLAWACGIEGRAIDVTVVSEKLDVSTATQRWSFLRGDDGTIAVETAVRSDKAAEAAWLPLFDARRPLVEGADFDLRPDEWTIVEQSPSRVVVLLTGRQADHGYPFEARVEFDDRTTLVRLLVVCHIETPITLRGLEPQLALWIDRPTIALSLGQGPGSIDQGSADRQWGNSFPAAYLWDGGREAAVFIAGESLDWMSPRTLFRFRDCRVAALADPERGQTGFGLQVVKRNFHELAVGDIGFDAWIHSAPAEKPTKQEALARMLRLFAPLHPATAAPLVDRLTGQPSSWRQIARGVDADLRLEGVVCEAVDLPARAPQSPADFLAEDVCSRLLVATDYALGSSCDAARDRRRVSDGWDFSTCHNGLATWLAHDRLHPDPDRHAFLGAKLRGMRFFLDSDAALIRHGTRNPPHVGDKEMAWQSLMFAIETARTWRMLDRSDVDPAIGGMVLVGTEGLVNLARENDHLLPQWLDPLTKRPLPQADQPDLGVVYEPWQLGSYAWLLTEAHAIDGDRARIDEAAFALRRLFAPLQWRVTNARYDIAYDDPTDYPVTEIFGNAWGIAACCRIRAITGDDSFDGLGDAFLDSLLRLTPWYESALRDDPRDRAVRNAGLFRNHAGAFTGSPWENSEAALALSVRIRDDLLRGRAPRVPLLELLNLQRVNAATFFPRCCPDEALPCARLADHPAVSLPIEDAYTPEHGGLHGGMGRAAYMAGAAFAYDLLFEALGRAADSDTMLLNLDSIEGSEASLRGLARHFVAFNPTSAPAQSRLSFDRLPAGRYRLEIDSRPPEEHSVEELADGVVVDLPPRGHVLVTIDRIDAQEALEILADDRRNADGLAREWADSHREFVRDGATPANLDRRAALRKAIATFRRGAAPVRD